MSENTQNHKNRLLDLEGTFYEKHEKSQKVRIRLTLPGTDKSTFCCDFGIPKNPTRDKCLPAGTQKWCVYTVLVGMGGSRGIVAQTDTHTNRLNPFETYLS